MSRLNVRNLKAKFREKGFAWVCRAAFHKLFGPLYRRLKRLARFMVWVIPAADRLLSPVSSGDRRLLMIYDLSAQPFSIGDILVIQEASLVLREKWQVDKVDFALLYNPQSPTSGDPAFSGITEENVMYHLASVLPAAQTNQHLGSLFLFNSQRQLQLFVSNSAEQYHVWPSATDIASREYLLYRVFNEMVYDYSREHGKIPYLSCRAFLIKWAEGFYEEHAASHVPVTVQIRNNKKISPGRNLRMQCWLEFFRYCEGRYPVKFVVICARHEVDDRLRQCPNVIIAKDHLTSLEQDLALIHTAALHMGAASGPGTMAVFGSKPYLLVNTDLGPGLYRDMVQTDDYVRFSFSLPSQRITLGPETTEVLIEEFARMWAEADLEGWAAPEKRAGQVEKEALTWLR
jgi:hypothetical protein